MNETTWIDDPIILFDKPFEFYPSKDDPLHTRINSLMRLAIYTSIVLIVYYSNAKPLLLVIITGIVTYYMWNNERKIKIMREGLGNADPSKTHPTKDNPMMNFTVSDLLNTDENGSIKPRLPISDPLEPKVAKEITDMSHLDMYRDVTDVFDKKLTDRQFYTMPVTDEVNDRETWQKWCYNTPASCKEDSICYKYEDLRANRPEFPIAKEVEKL
jgi:hypothetical protein